MSLNLTLVLKIAMLIASTHSYCYPGQLCFRYNCADFAKDLVLALRAEGINAYPVCGWLNHRYHAWVVVEENKTDWFWARENPNLIHIEPQTGEIIYPEEDMPWLSYYARGRKCVVRGIY